MKKILSLILAIVLAFSTAITVFAQSFIPTADKTAVNAGEDVTITLSFEEAVVDVTTFEARLYFNDKLFSYKESTLTSANGYVTPDPQKDAEGTYMEITHVELSGKGTVAAGEYAKITFTAKENVSSEQTAEFVGRVEEMVMADGPQPTTENVKITVTVSPVICDHSETETAYTSNRNGSHTVTVTCKKCSAVISTSEETCTKGEDGKCTHCGYVFPATGDEYTITVNVAPSTVDVTFYGDENATTALAAEKVVDKGVSGKYHIYEITVPKGTYSYRAFDNGDDRKLGGMTFTAPVSIEVGADGTPIREGQKMTLLRVNHYTNNSKVTAVGDYNIEIYPADSPTVVNGEQYIDDNDKVVTATMLWAHGNALLYSRKVTLKEELAKNYGVKFEINKTFSDTSYNTYVWLFNINKLSEYSITAPKDATVKFFNQINYFNDEELPATEVKENTDGTVTYILRTALGDNLTYRVSMEGKVTKAGYLGGSTASLTITFADNENPKSTVNKMNSAEMKKRIESSVLVNVNAQNELSLGVGKTFRLRSYRGAWQIINSDTANIMIEPDFNYKIISGGEHIRMTPATNRCTGNAGTGEHSNWMDIEGVSEGIAIIEVSYDAIEIGSAPSVSKYTGTYGATDPKRTALVVINVGGAENELSMTAKEADHEWDAEFDTVYTFENTATLNFTATLGGAQPTVQLSTDKGASWKNVVKNSDGTFTASGLVEGNNILKFTANGKTAYQVVRAAKLTYTVTNLTTKDATEIYVGDTARVVFNGFYQPMPKISGIYNPGIGGALGNQIVYDIPNDAEQGGRSEQYSFVNTNKYDITINEEGKFVLTGGYITFYVYAHKDFVGEHRTITDNGVSTNFNAINEAVKYCVMPDLTIEVKVKEEHSWSEPSYSWNSNNSTCTATRSCSLHSDETQTETVNTTKITKDATCTENGEVKYTASFKNSAFAKQEKVVVIPAKGHDLVHHAAKEATCVAEGNIEYWQCSVCKKLFSDDKGVNEVASVGTEKNPNKHVGGTELKNKKDATCTENGYTGDTCCKSCEAIIEKGKETDKIPHTLIHHSAKEATCVAEGNIEYWQCSVCKKLFSDDKGVNEVASVITEKNPNKHVGGTVLKNEKSATCGEEGYTGDIYCKSCGALIDKGSVTPKTPHKWGTPTYTWSSDYKTCTANVVCNNDSTHKESVTVNATVESEGATCTEKGKVTYTAEFGKNEYGFTTQTKVDENAALGHDWGEATYKWSEDNKTVTATHICQRDGSHTESKSTNKITTETIKAATCTEKGKGKYVANFEGTGFANTEKEFEIPAKGHDLVHHAAKEATCVAEGNIEYWQCSVCKKLFSDDKGVNEVASVGTEKNPNKHVGGTELKNKKDATCTENGYTGDTCCKSCEAIIEKGKETDKIPHTLIHHAAKEATCVAEGNIEYWQCSVCKKLFSDDKGVNEVASVGTEKNPNKHVGGTELKNKKDATCTENGYTGDTCCKSCEAIIEKGKETDKIPHTLIHHSAKEATCVAEGNIEYWQCSVCKKLFSDDKGVNEVASVGTEKNPNKHVGGTELKNKKDATCTENGYTGDTCCKSCEAILQKGAEIPMTEHVWGKPSYVWSTDNKTVTAERTCVNDKVTKQTETKNTTAKTIKEANCTEGGKVEYTADFTGSNYGFETQIKTVDTTALGHKLTHHDAKAATCVAEGSIEYWECGVCKKLYSDKDCKNEVISTVTAKNPNNHIGETEVKNYKEATCTESGYTGDTYCKSCSKLIAAGKVSPVVPHVFGAWTITKQPTISAEGEKVRYCEKCHYEQKMTIPSLSDDSKPIHIVIGGNKNQNEQNPETGAQAPSGLAAIAVLIVSAVLIGKNKRR